MAEGEILHDSMLAPASGSESSVDASLLPEAGGARPRITVIDDSPDFLDLMRDVLEAEHEVLTYNVVRSIAEIAASSPDLLLIDLHSGARAGGLTGWEILALARSHPDLRDVPAVVCSADFAALREDRIRLLSYGDVQLVAKPFDVHAFEQTIERMLRLSGTERRAPVQDAGYPPLQDAWPAPSGSDARSE
jgi:CheY-like chemotaxis protein